MKDFGGDDEISTMGDRRREIRPRCTGANRPKGAEARCRIVWGDLKSLRTRAALAPARRSPSISRCSPRALEEVQLQPVRRQYGVPPRGMQGGGLHHSAHQVLPGWRSRLDKPTGQVRLEGRRAYAFQPHFADAMPEFGAERLARTGRVLSLGGRSLRDALRRTSSRWVSRTLPFGSTVSWHRCCLSHTSLSYGPLERGLPFFLGRVLQRDGPGIYLQASKSYAHEMVDLIGLRTGKSVGTTVASSPTKKEDCTSHLHRARD